MRQLSMWLLAASCAAATAFASGAEQGQPTRFRAYVGTYTSGASEGIYVFDFDATDGRAGAVRLAAIADNPSFLAVHPQGDYLYAVNEIGQYEGKPAGSVSAFAIDASSGKLTLLNRQSSHGGAPCHLVVDRSGTNVLVANYTGGNVAVLPIQADGSLAPASSVIQHEGSSVNPQRQREPHAHAIHVDAQNRFALAADLGIDRVLVYRFDPEQGTLQPNEPPGVALPPGAGPRHLAFHPSNRLVYVINELNCTVTACYFDQDLGTLEAYQTISTLPEGVAGQGFSTAEIVVHPSGQFLYGSNRGHHSLAIFSIEPVAGRLAPVGHQPTGGETPRNFAIDPTGRYLLAENQGSGTVVVFQIDPHHGKLTATGQTLAIPSPVCIRFVP